MKSSIKELAALIYADPTVVDLYILHDSYGLSPGEALFAAKFFSRVGIVSISGSKVIVGGTAREWLYARRKRFFLDSRRPWSEARRPLPDPGEPYLPSLKRVDRRFFVSKVASPQRAR